MAKVTLVFEDCEDGVSVSMISDPPFPHRVDFSSQDPDLSDAQHMAMGVVDHLERKAQEKSESTTEGHKCSHSHGKHQCQKDQNPDGKCCRKQDAQSENCCEH